MAIVWTPDDKLTVNNENYWIGTIDIKGPDPYWPHCFVFLGDGNHSFSRAFAKFRGSGQEVVPTHYPDDAGASQVQDVAAALPDSAGGGDQDAAAAAAAAAGPNPAGVGETVEPQMKPSVFIDATSMGSRTDFIEKLKINPDGPITLWFQCPWYGGNENLFLRSVMLSAAGVQYQGELLLIGVVTDTEDSIIKHYVPRYGKLQATFGEFYTCLGADTKFVGQMHGLGYKHRTNTDRNIITNYDTQMATLVFQRNGAPLEPLPLIPGVFVNQSPITSEIVYRVLTNRLEIGWKYLTQQDYAILVDFLLSDELNTCKNTCKIYLQEQGQPTSYHFRLDKTLTKMFWRDDSWW